MTKEETVSYVADMAQQLAEFVREHQPTVAQLLEAAAALARDVLQRAR